LCTTTLVPITIIVITFTTHKKQNHEWYTISKLPLYLGLRSFKLNNTIRNALWKFIINEHFGSKVERLVGWVQMVVPSLVTKLQSFKSSTKCESS
jgi:hypothetical protein